MRGLILAALLTLAFAVPAAAQDTVGVSYDDGQIWYLNTGEVAGIDWTWIHCNTTAVQATLMTWAGYDLSGTTGKVLFAACAAGVIYNALYAWVSAWNGYMMDVSYRYFGNSLQWTYWIQLGGY